MNYSETIAYLFGLQRFGIKLGLRNITTLLRHLGEPQRHLRFIHIAGTNGKGSTAAFLLSILKQAGCRAGLYTSPHLVDFTERIRINDIAIDRDNVVRLAGRIMSVCARASLHHITYFEFVTALALSYFADQKADPVILEVGMGGRYDATNIVKPLVAIITSVSLDHQMYLGKTLASIAAEKAGIIKKSVPVVSGVRQTIVKKVLESTASDLKAPQYRLGYEFKSRKAGQSCFHYAGLNIRLHKLRCGLRGDHQIRNAALSVCAAEVLKKSGYVINENAVRSGLCQARWPGRCEVISERPTVILDGAHNTEAWKECLRTIQACFTYRRLLLLLGVMRDKAIDKMIKILAPSASMVVCCRPRMERAADKRDFDRLILFSGRTQKYWIEDSTQAMRFLVNRAGSDDLICVTGSLFLVGEVRELMLPVDRMASGRISL